jgi:hypothetical protein
VPSFQRGWHAAIICMGAIGWLANRCSFRASAGTAAWTRWTSPRSSISSDAGPMTSKSLTCTFG